MELKPLKDGRCPRCRGTEFLADELLAWEGSTTDVEDPTRGDQMHLFKNPGSVTDNIICKRCLLMIDPESLDFYYD